MTLLLYKSTVLQCAGCGVCAKILATIHNGELKIVGDPCWTSNNRKPYCTDCSPISGESYRHAEHIEYPLEDWQYEVSNGDTRQGYRAWVWDKLREGV